MKEKVLLALVIGQLTSSAATISNFSGGVDDFYNAVSFRFTVAPIDFETPNGIDSIEFSLSGVGVGDEPFNNSSFATNTDEFLATGPFLPILSTSANGNNFFDDGSLEFLSGNRVVVSFPSILSSEATLDITIWDITTTGIQIPDAFIFPGNDQFSVDLILNPSSGTTPSILGEQVFAGIGQNEDFSGRFLGVPEPSPIILFAFSVGSIFMRRRR